MFKKIKTKEEVLAEQHVHVHNEPECPTCKGKEGHVLKETPEGLKCSGDGCNEEFYKAQKDKWTRKCPHCGKKVELSRPSKFNDCPFCDKEM